MAQSDHSQTVLGTMPGRPGTVQLVEQYSSGAWLLGWLRGSLVSEGAAEECRD